jgi:hypothetical protein
VDYYKAIMEKNAARRLPRARQGDDRFLGSGHDRCGNQGQLNTEGWRDMDGELNIGTPQNTLVEYSPIEAALNQFRGRYAGRVYDVTTAAGMKDARAARMEVRSARTELERVRKSIKEPALRRCQLIDSEAKRITAALVEIEDPIDECIKAEETRKEREKAEREAAEKRRVDEIQARITALHRAPNWGDGSAEIKQAIAEIEAVTITEDKFFEFGLAAEAVKFNTLSTLRAALATVLEKEQAAELARIAREAEEQRIAAERAEHERVMAEEKAARDAAAAEQRANLEAARAEQEAILAAERAELDARKAAEKAERERVEAEDAAEARAQRAFEDERAGRPGRPNAWRPSSNACAPSEAAEVEQVRR